jgi:hypothetical protein
MTYCTECGEKVQDDQCGQICAECLEYEAREFICDGCDGDLTKDGYCAACETDRADCNYKAHKIDRMMALNAGLRDAHAYFARANEVAA